MSNTLSALRRKIGVAGDLQSVVRTMKSVAASNIGQYENSVKALVDYSRAVELGLSVCLRGLQKGIADDKPPGLVAAIVFGSDQGLIGPFNEAVADYSARRLREISRPLTGVRTPRLKVWTVGERVSTYLESSGLVIQSVFGLPISVANITPLVQQLIHQILLEIRMDREGSAPDELYLFYNHPRAGSTYEPIDLKLLPFNLKWRNDLIHLRWPTGMRPEIIDHSESDSEKKESERTVLKAFVREYIFVSIFRACAESLTSENASRLSAMQRADKNIEDLLVNLNETYHRSRQSEIDEELFDVVASFEIMSKTIDFQPSSKTSRRPSLAK